MADLFGSSSMGEGYANARPPIHPIVIDRVRAQLGRETLFRRALDIGCGAGLSTRPLLAASEQTIAIDPSQAMVRRGAKVAPGAAFLVGRAEALPVRDHSVDLMTAAGSLNYADLDRFFPEAARVLTADGVLVVYDFSQGRSFRDSKDLDVWFDEFLARFPAPPDPINQLDGEILGRISKPLRMVSQTPFEIPLSVSPRFYVDYIMTETNISNAVAQGAVEAEIRTWCESSLAPVFSGEDKEVLFRGYYALLKKS